MVAKVERDHICCGQILGGEDSHQKEAERTTCCLKARK